MRGPAVCPLVGRTRSISHCARYTECAQLCGSDERISHTARFRGHRARIVQRIPTRALLTRHAIARPTQRSPAARRRARSRARVTSAAGVTSKAGLRQRVPAERQLPATRAADLVGIALLDLDLGARLAQCEVDRRGWPGDDERDPRRLARRARARTCRPCWRRRRWPRPDRSRRSPRRRLAADDQTGGRRVDDQLVRDPESEPAPTRSASRPAAAVVTPSQRTPSSAAAPSQLGDHRQRRAGSRGRERAGVAVGEDPLARRQQIGPVRGPSPHSPAAPRRGSPGPRAAPPRRCRPASQSESPRRGPGRRPTPRLTAVGRAPRGARSQARRSAPGAGSRARARSRCRTRLRPRSAAHRGSPGANRGGDLLGAAQRQLELLERQQRLVERPQRAPRRTAVPDRSRPTVATARSYGASATELSSARAASRRAERERLSCACDTYCWHRSLPRR